MIYNQNGTTRVSKILHPSESFPLKSALWKAMCILEKCNHVFKNSFRASFLKNYLQLINFFPFIMWTFVCVLFKKSSSTPELWRYSSTFSLKVVILFKLSHWNLNVYLDLILVYGMGWGRNCLWSILPDQSQLCNPIATLFLIPHSRSTFYMLGPSLLHRG